MKIIGPFKQVVTLANLPLRGSLKDEQLEIIEKPGILIESLALRASIGLGDSFAPARKILDGGGILAIATDWNPGFRTDGKMLTTEQIENKLLEADKAFGEWRKVAFEEKQELLAKAAQLLLDKSEEYGKIITREMNKPISQLMPRFEKIALMIELLRQGSEYIKAGRSVKALPGVNLLEHLLLLLRLQYLKNRVLELGGAMLLLSWKIADFDKAARPKRFIIHQNAEKRILPKFIEEFKKYVPGDPNDKETKLSAMARKDLADDLEAQYKKALDNGAEPIVPLERISDIAFKPGLMRVNEGNPVLEEELFGPLEIQIWTKDKAKVFFFAENLESGSVAVNEMTKSMPDMPLGGAKRSGYGTELSLFALKEFTIPKSIIGTL
ncbi:hypothetical protein FQR65_LT18250 [Abscondita terminalis]|nr:hypothetical protein FQR65_LT18250 [Abscondita terminalis]